MYLNSHTYYSLKYGTLKLKELLQAAENGKWNCFALTDINNTSTTLDFIRTAPKHGIKPVVGVDFRNGAQQQYVIIARNNKGFQKINEHLSTFSHQGLPYPQKCPLSSDVWVVYPFDWLSRWDITPERLEEQLEHHEFIGIPPRALNKIVGNKWKKVLHKMVAMPTGTFRNKRDFNAHRLLRSIDNNVLLSKLSKSEEGDPGDLIRTRDQLKEIYQRFPEMIERAETLLTDCSIHFDFGTDHPHKNLQTYTGSNKEDAKLINQLCLEGLAYRYPNADETVMNRLEKELSII
ncbi:MAG: PHP domain-containing protein, partial [Bacteroidota bacterium]